MRTTLFRGLAFVVVLLMLFTASVAPVLAKGAAKSITFSDAIFVVHKGFVFKFNITGDFQEKDLHGVVYAGKHRYALNCVQSGSSLSCLADTGLTQLVGRTVFGVVGGFAFSAVIPARIYCYGIFDYGHDDVWRAIGSYCRTVPSMPSTIKYYNPDYNDTFTYYYYNNGSSAACQDPPVPDFGPGFYYDDPNYCSGN